MASAAHAVARRFDALRFHVAQPRDDRPRSFPRYEPGLGERDGVRLVEGVKRSVASTQVRQWAGIETLRKARIDLAGQTRARLADDIGHCRRTPLTRGCSRLAGHRGPFDMDNA